MSKTKYAHDRWEYPRLPVVPARIRRRRFALTLALTAIFFAGAALAAGADTQLAQSAGASSVTAPTDTTTTDTTATDPTADAATTTVDATADATTTTESTPPPTDATPTDETPTTDAAPATTVGDAATDTVPSAPTTDAAAGTDAAPAATADPATVPALPAPDAAAADAAGTAVVESVGTALKRAPVPRTAVRMTAVHRHKTAAAKKKKTTPVRTLDRPLSIPYHAIVFDPQQWLNENPGTPTGQAAVAIAMNYLGVPYRWGGAIPETGFDCSGLVRFVYAQLGVNLVHYAASQFAAFPKLSPAQLQPGDLVFFEPKLDGPGHVGLYVGHDEMIEAPHTGAVVRIASVSGAAAQLGFMGAVRPYGSQLLGGLTPLSVVASRPAASLLSMIAF